MIPIKSADQTRKEMQDLEAMAAKLLETARKIPAGPVLRAAIAIKLSVTVACFEITSGLFRPVPAGWCWAPFHRLTRRMAPEFPNLLKNVVACRVPPRH